MGDQGWRGLHGECVWVGRVSRMAVGEEQWGRRSRRSPCRRGWSPAITGRCSLTAVTRPQSRLLICGIFIFLLQFLLAGFPSSLISPFFVNTMCVFLRKNRKKDSRWAVWWRITRWVLPLLNTITYSRLFIHFLGKVCIWILIFDLFFPCLGRFFWWVCYLPPLHRSVWIFLKLNDTAFSLPNRPVFNEVGISEFSDASVSIFDSAVPNVVVCLLMGSVGKKSVTCCWTGQKHGRWLTHRIK